MSDRLLRVFLGLLALAGAAVAGYLVWARRTGAELACSTGGCETVQSSEYAELLGVPVAVLGLAAYLVVGATALGAEPAARAVRASEKRDKTSVSPARSGTTESEADGEAQAEETV